MKTKIKDIEWSSPDLTDQDKKGRQIDREKSKKLCRQNLIQKKLSEAVTNES